MVCYSHGAVFNRELVMNSKTDTKKKINFEKALLELEKIVDTMESRDVSLETSLKMYQRGAELLKICHHQINDAQQKVEILDKETLKMFPSE
tara:strand:- start:139 stop:414 length:276 start_codon:yes stop_codon:yes gene_type:complete